MKNKKTKLPLIEIKPKDPRKILTGANCLLLINGKPVRGATRVRIDVRAGGVGKATVDLIGRIKATGYILGSYNKQRVAK